MEGGITLLMLIIVGLAILFALVTGTGSRSTDEYENEIRALREIIAKDVERERMNQTAPGGSTLADAILAVVLGLIIIVALSSMAIATVP